MRNSARGRHGKALWLVPALLGFVAGTAAQLAQPVLFDPVVYGVLMCLAPCTAGWLRARRAVQWAASGVLVLSFAALGFGLTGLRAVVYQARALAPQLEGRDLVVTGVVAAMPQLSEQGVRLRLHVELATDQGVPVRLPPAIALGWYLAGVASGADDAGDSSARLPDLRAGERWRMQVRLKAPHGNSNPGGFDYELWMWEQGLQASGYVRQGMRDVVPTRLGQTWRHPVELARQAVRERIERRVGAHGQAGWITALVTGDQNAIERADWDVFRATGVAHLMAISGLHVTMFAWLAGAWVGALWRRVGGLCLWLAASHAALVGGLALAWLYAVFSGWGVPSQRTVWMLAVACLLRLSGRSWPWPLVWLLAGAVVLLIDPWAFVQAGFWLSFVAVGVLFAAAGRQAGTGAGVAVRLLALLREQWTITLALTPLVLLLFGQFSVVGFAANLLAIPWVTLLVTPLSLAGVLFAPCWDLALWAVEGLAGYLQGLAALPFATVSVATAPWWIGVVGVAGGLLLVVRWPAGLRLAGAAWLLPVLLWQAPRPVPGQFDLLAADVGQGNAVLVRTTNHAMLYDAGPRYSRDSDAGHRVLVPLLRARAVRLDLLVLSHRDADHTGGAASVLAMQPQARLLSSIGADHELHALHPLRCEAGQRWTWDGVAFEVLHPRAQDYTSTARPNALSCVLRIASAPGTAPQRSALLAGDIELAQETRLQAERADIRSDLLLVPHHGSKTSSSGGFLDAVAPRLALVQSGYRNRFGHPAAAPLARYHGRGIVVLDSPHCGAMSWRSQAPADVRCERRSGLRYWHHQAP